MLSEDVSTLWRSQPNFTFGGHVPDEGSPKANRKKGGQAPRGLWVSEARAKPFMGHTAPNPVGHTNYFEKIVVVCYNYFIVYCCELQFGRQL